ncbi:DUF4432 family protein [Robbsia sp. Bb-Pol-6]|uniref:DUF4432 family protein n=1 Tax=Robbsia betulipollinis TaxID=2981849 RepID=A0ABT3ZHQ1_9BURK|nr:DUF4432 family protein [Robbsia betulipollinis]MCY0385860.1 DUF4432 family protein [Robbsia betulipollinis]
MHSFDVSLSPDQFGATRRCLIDSDVFGVELFRYATGVPAVRLKNARGFLEVLPYCGQMIWSARFDGVDLAMGSPFRAPRPTRDLLATYGCFLYHSGILRNGNPGPDDDHALHGEMPCAPMEKAKVSMGADDGGPYLELTSECEYLRGFGDHYLARPAVRLRPESACFEVRMAVRNLGREPMDLMYMCHANFAFHPDARLIQPAAFDASHTAIRASVPAIVEASPEYLQRLAALGRDPSATETLDRLRLFDPEVVFYLRQLRESSDGLTRFMMRRADGSASCVRYRQREFPHAIRWLLNNSRAQVAGFAMPATCEVEGYAAERKKGNVRQLAGGATAEFSVELGHLTQVEAAAEERMLRDGRRSDAEGVSR